MDDHEHHCHCAPRDVWLANVRDHIDNPGWSIVHVGGARPGEPPVVSWAYTIGLLENFDHPELIVMGLSIPSSGFMLNTVGSAIAAGSRFVPGPAVHSFDHVELQIGSVDPEHWETERFAGWHDYYGTFGDRPPIPLAVQVIWPDPDGHLPDDPAYDPRCEILQPFLAVPPSPAELGMG